MERGDVRTEQAGGEDRPLRLPHLRTAAQPIRPERSSALTNAQSRGSRTASSALAALFRCDLVSVDGDDRELGDLAAVARSLPTPEND
jgi:hypothetical protein